MRVPPWSLALLLLGSCSSKTTYRDLLEDITEARCTRANTCDPPVPDNCVAETVEAGCRQIDCGRELTDAELAEGEACVAAWATMECEAFNAGQSPEACQ
jgi:hypothetical protein